MADMEETQRFVIIWPDGRVDPALFDTEGRAAAEAVEAFDQFTIAEIVPVATYRVETTQRVIRKAVK